MVSADARQILAVRRHTLGWVSQFLRVIPRISALEVVMQPLLEQGVERAECRERAEALLAALNVPQRLWPLAPSTFSGGEQQRVNIARGFIVDYPILLLDEPTASLDSRNSAAVVQLIERARRAARRSSAFFTMKAFANRSPTGFMTCRRRRRWRPSDDRQ